MPPDSPKVFISYSHDSEQHKASILALADRLCREGLDCTIDQYINGFPPEGWQRWMDSNSQLEDLPPNAGGLALGLIIKAIK